MALNLRRRAFCGALAVLAIAVAGCERMRGPTKIAEAFKLICDPAQLSLTAGARGMLVARALDAAGKPIDGARLQFTASDAQLVRVTALGEVKSVGPAGRTSILITSGSQSLTVPIDIAAGLRNDSAQSKGPTARWLLARLPV